jgi:pyridoxine/pyridoxamine 5'-phosphate oxidase
MLDAPHDARLARNHPPQPHVQASVSPTGAPQAAVVGFAVTDALEIIFDTVATSRKYRNLRADPRVALVIGWERATAWVRYSDFTQNPPRIVELGGTLA